MSPARILTHVWSHEACARKGLLSCMATAGPLIWPNSHVNTHTPISRESLKGALGDRRHDSYNGLCAR